MTALVHYSVENGVARLTLDSPHNRNAMSTALVDQLRQGLTDAADDPGVRVVVLGHTGGTFCAGADLSEAAGRDPGDLATARALEAAGLLRSILELPVPVIAAIDGHVRAGGMGLIGACDLVVAGTASTFALTEARIGVAPSIISLTLLPKMTARAAGRYFVTGEKFGAEEAERIGLVSMAVEAEVLRDTAFDVAKKLATGPQTALRWTKHSLNNWLRQAGPGFDASLALEFMGFGGPDVVEGLAALRERRPPRF